MSLVGGSTAGGVVAVEVRQDVGVGRDVSEQRHPAADRSVVHYCHGCD